jgi:hypothetical protein
VVRPFVSDGSKLKSLSGMGRPKAQFKKGRRKQLVPAQEEKLPNSPSIAVTIGLPCSMAVVGCTTPASPISTGQRSGESSPFC